MNMPKKGFWVLAIGLLIFGANLGGYPIYILDEAKNATCAAEMWQRGDWVVPTFNGMLRTDKPVLHYYFMRAGYALLGVTSLAARLFSAVAGLATVWVLFAFVRRLLDERAAWCTALCFIASLQVAVQFRLAVPDPYLIFFVTTGLLCFTQGHVLGKRKYFLLAYLCFALGFMAKGPIAVVLPGAAALLFLLWEGKFHWATLRQIQLGWGIIIFLAVVLPWWVAVGIETQGAWVKGFLFDHNINRFTNTMEGHKGFPGLSVLLVFAALLPFSFFLPRSLAFFWLHQRQQPLLRLSVIYTLVIILFFSLSKTLLPTYIGPALPFVAVVIGFWVSRARTHSTSRYWPEGILTVIVCVALPVAAWLALRQDVLLREAAPVAACLLPCVAGGVAGFLFLLRWKVLAAFHCYAVGFMAAALLLFCVGLPVVTDYNPVARSLPLLRTASTPIVIYQIAQPAYLFHLQRTLPVLHTPEELSAFRQAHGPCRVLSRAKNAEELAHLHLREIFRGQDLFEIPLTVVLEYP
jgi:4-amino-4-deoxy-L-arabinose transferase-like glycosyltransferase